MATVSIIIETDNAAFEDEGEATEVARILRTYADHLAAVGAIRSRGLVDINGNRCGTVRITD